MSISDGNQCKSLGNRLMQLWFSLLSLRFAHAQDKQMRTQHDRLNDRMIDRYELRTMRDDTNKLAETNMSIGYIM